MIVQNHLKAILDQFTVSDSHLMVSYMQVEVKMVLSDCGKQLLGKLMGCGSVCSMMN